MPRGRPKGSKNKKIVSKIDINSMSSYSNEEIKTYEKAINNKSILTPVYINLNKTTRYATCELCGKEIKCQPITINLNHLTGKASWHRECNKDRFNICDECAKQLSDVVDKFIKTKNKELNKFEIVD